MIDKDTITKAAKGDARCMRAVIDQYTPLVHKLVNRYAFMAPSHSKEDMFQEGVIGLVTAVKRYDPERPTCFMTLAFPTVRGAVQNFARKEKKHPKYILPLDKADWDGNLTSEEVFELKDHLAAEMVEEIILHGCGSLDNEKARIVCDRFGLMGRQPMRQGAVAEKYGLTKQTLNSRMRNFNKKVQQKYPELRGMI